jgi:hypothetical protein
MGLRQCFPTRRKAERDRESDLTYHTGIFPMTTVSIVTYEFKNYSISLTMMLGYNYIFIVIMGGLR